MRPPLSWAITDRCYVPRKGIGVVVGIGDHDLTVMLPSAKMVKVLKVHARLPCDAPVPKDVDYKGQKHMPFSKPKRIEPESSVLARVMAALKAQPGVLAMRNTVGSTRTVGGYITYGLGRGSPDVVAIVAPMGRWVCIEVKRPKDSEAEEHQVAWLDRARELGAVAGVCRSPEEALALVEEARKSA